MPALKTPGALALSAWRAKAAQNGTLYCRLGQIDRIPYVVMTMKDVASIDAQLFDLPRGDTITLS